MGEDTYQVAIWMQLGYLLTDSPLMAWGVGQLFFASLAWNSDLLPRWLAVIGAIGGLSLVLASLDLPSQAGLLVFLALVSFAIWAFATATVVIRRGTNARSASTADGPSINPGRLDAAR